MATNLLSDNLEGIRAAQKKLKKADAQIGDDGRQILINYDVLTAIGENCPFGSSPTVG